MFRQVRQKIRTGLNRSTEEPPEDQALRLGRFARQGKWLLWTLKNDMKFANKCNKYGNKPLTTQYSTSCYLFLVYLLDLMLLGSVRLLCIIPSHSYHECPAMFEGLVSDSCPVEDFMWKIFRGRGWHRDWKFEMPPTPTRMRHSATLCACKTQW